MRLIGSQVLTFEELYTLLVQIETVLNSRPLCAVNSDPNEPTFLTPGHFLLASQPTYLIQIYPICESTDLIGGS